MIVRKIYLPVPLNTYLFEIWSITGNESCKWHIYFLITNLRMSLNSVINLYQDILKILNREPTKDITKDKISSFIDFKVKSGFFFYHPRCV